MTGRVVGGPEPAYFVIWGRLIDFTALMIRYLETFYRHRFLLLIPVVLTTAVSLVFVLSQPRIYESTAQLWFDSSSASINLGSPADQGAAQFKEILKTRSFCTKVGSSSPLASDVAAKLKASPDLITRILHKFQGGLASSDPAALDAALYDTINKNTTVTVTGPEIVSITFDYSDPVIAAKTAQAIVDEFSTELLGGRRIQAQATLTFYDQQVKSQQTELAAADAAVYAYLQAHPAQQAPTAVPDVDLTALRRTDDFARTRYESLLAKLDQARLDVAAGGQLGAAGFRIIDAPQVPYRSKGFVRSAAFGAAGGLGAGLFISLLALLALTAGDTSFHRPEELSADLGQRVVGTIPRAR
jgi:uncharacterized protein involved in exopolysaccharide biosynthesis